MREIIGHLTTDLEKHCNGTPPSKAEAFPIKDYKELVHHIARLSCLNKDYLLLFRGQAGDYLNKSGATTLYPAIYRGERVSRAELELRTSILTTASNALSELLTSNKIEGSQEVKRRKYIRWSILQHYEVCSTPLLDLTQSLRVACSFALDGGPKSAFIYVLGLPYPTNRVSINSEHDLVNIRLLSICPPDAQRPYFQEGFLAGTDESIDDFDTKSELDLNRRLIAKFEIVSPKSFWSEGFDAIPRSALYPNHDIIAELCQQISSDFTKSASDQDIGAFLRNWSALESLLTTNLRNKSPNNTSTYELIRNLASREMLNSKQIKELDSLRALRNKVVHAPYSVDKPTMKTAASLAAEYSEIIRNAIYFDHIKS